MSDDRKGKRKEPDYEVGYGRPPKETRFKPGQSGNPKGRKRKPQSVREQMREILDGKIQVAEGGVVKKRSRRSVMLTSVANNAAKGDLKAADFVLGFSEALEKPDQDPNQLSPEEQMLLEKIIRDLRGEGWDMQSGRSDAEPPATRRAERDADD